MLVHQPLQDLMVLLHDSHGTLEVLHVEIMDPPIHRDGWVTRVILRARAEGVAEWKMLEG